jgi:phosphate transport system substrate-binding protein
MVPIRQVIEPFIEESAANFQQRSRARGFQLRYTDPVGKAPGSGSGIEMLLEGQLSFSESSRPLKVEEYEAARQRGFELEQIAVAIDGIAIAVDPNLDIDGLTIEQLGDIYTGRVTNWSQVGGPDLEIIPFSKSPEVGGTAEFFIENVMDGDSFHTQVEFIDTTTAGLREVADTPGGIYYVSAPEVVEQCTVRTLPLAKGGGSFIPPYQPPFVSPGRCPEERNQLNAEAFREGTYPLTRQLFVIVKQNGEDEEVAGRAYADILRSDEGQALIEEAGFIGIR